MFRRRNGQKREVVILSAAKDPRISRLLLLPLILAFTTIPACAQLPLRPSGLAYDSAGNLYYADTARNQIFEATAAGTLVLIAGTGEQGFSGDTGPATAALLNAPQALTIASDGTLYLADTGNNRIRSISPTGIITTLASSLHMPTALALDTANNLLIADTAAHKILRLNGTTLTTLAGTGTQGFFGDSGPATSALLDSPSGLAVLPDGRILLADTHNHRLRAIALDGTITTLAGTGIRGFSGDNGPATAAQLALPRGLATLSDGTVLLADTDNHRLRSISPTGIITTLAGTGTQGVTPDAIAATTATLDTPRSITTNPFGAPVFTDHLLHALLSQTLYLAATETPHATTLTLNTTPTTATVTVQGTAATPQGTITLRDGPTTLSTATLTNGAITIPLALTAGPHTLTATYSGDVFNPSATTSTTLTTSLTPTITTLTLPATTYAGLPLALTASVTPPAATGTITFTESGQTIATARLTNGLANAVYLAPTAGQRNLLATYSGDATFAPSTSATTLATVAPMPDFTLTVAGPTAQTANNGATLTYALALTASPAPFSGAISLSASGLPTTTTVTFAPPQVIPGTGTATTTLSIPTDKLLATAPQLSPLFFALLLLPLLARKRKPLALLLLLATTGCGTRIAPGSTPQSRSYTVTITAIGTNLAGALLTHTAQVQLTVQ